MNVIKVHRDGTGEQVMVQRDVVELPCDLAQHMKKAATEEHMALTGWMVRLLEKEFAGKERRRVAPTRWADGPLGEN
jgi:hypothetical protein